MCAQRSVIVFLTEFGEAVRGRKEKAETDCTEAGLAEKSKAAAGAEVENNTVNMEEK